MPKKTKQSVPVSVDGADSYLKKTIARVTEIKNNQQFSVEFEKSLKSDEAEALIAPDNLFMKAGFKFTSGTNNEISGEILSNSGNSLTLTLPMINSVAVGDVLELTLNDSLFSKTATKSSLELTVTHEHINSRHFVMLGRSEDGKFISAEAWDEKETVAFGAKTIEQILSEVGISFDERIEKLTITFSPNTGDVIAVV